MFLRFAHQEVLYILLPLYCAAVLWRCYFYRPARYVYPLSGYLSGKGVVKKTYRHYILFALRASALLLLTFLIARPQWVDERSVINVDGVDIVLAIDISGSMQAVDDLKDSRDRITVAKEEAINFIEKRTNDALGVVVFAGEALSLSPLTLDKNILKQVVGSLFIGFVNEDGTYLGTGLATAINRLRKSKAKSKVVILLTDGVPSPEDPISPEKAVQYAKEFGIKVYSIAVGGTGICYQRTPYGMRPCNNQPINIPLLQTLAKETGGVFFRASNPQDMRVIYSKIDALEKTDYQTNLFHRYYEAFLTFIWFFLALFLLEFIVRLSIWRGV